MGASTIHNMVIKHVMGVGKEVSSWSPGWRLGIFRIAAKDFQTNTIVKLMDKANYNWKVQNWNPNARCADEGGRLYNGGKRKETNILNAFLLLNYTLSFQLTKNHQIQWWCHKVGKIPCTTLSTIPKVLGGVVTVPSLTPLCLLIPINYVTSTAAISLYNINGLDFLKLKGTGHLSTENQVVLPMCTTNQ